MPRSDVERLVLAIAGQLDTEAAKPHEAKELRALLRAAERMRRPQVTRDWVLSALAYDRAKARLLGGKA